MERVQSLKVGMEKSGETEVEPLGGTQKTWEGREWAPGPEEHSV